MDVSNDVKPPVYRESDGYVSQMPKWKRTLIYFVIGLGGIFTLIFMRRLADKQSERKRLREKVRYFKPTITESSISKSISWEMRDTPLTDEQLDAFMESQKFM